MTHQETIKEYALRRFREEESDLLLQAATCPATINYNGDGIPIKMSYELFCFVYYDIEQGRFIAIECYDAKGEIEIIKLLQ